MKQSVTCPCGIQTFHKKTNNVGEKCKLTNYHAVFSYTETIIYLCPKCTEKAKQLAIELSKVMGSNDFHIPSILK